MSTNTKNHLLLAQQLKRIQVEYITGDYTQCLPAWRQENAVPDYNKLYYVVNGECHLQIEDKAYTAKPGQMYLLPAGTRQTYYNISENRVCKYWIHFSTRYNESDIFEQISLPHFIQVRDDAYVSGLFSQIVQSSYSALPDILRCNASICFLLSYYLQQADVEMENILSYKNLNETKILTLLAYIEKNLHKDITVSDLCALSKLHPNYFIRYFKEKTGSPPMEFINDLRIGRAKHLLRNTQEPVQAIAFAVGFTDSNYFSSFFRKKTGFSPTEYRVLQPKKIETETRQ